MRVEGKLMLKLPSFESLVSVAERTVWLEGRGCWWTEEIWILRAVKLKGLMIP